MVKEKKLTKSSIAIIVLALLLVASLIMGMTGAWFTSRKAPADMPATFGTVSIDLGGEVSMTRWESTLDKLMPGDKINAITVTNGSNVGIYVRYKLEVTLDGYTAAQTRVNADTYTESAEDQAQKAADLELVACNTQLQTLFGQANWRYVKTPGNSTTPTAATFDAAAYSTTTLSANATGDGTNQIINPTDTAIYIDAIEFAGPAYGNAFQGKLITVHFEVEAIQSANFANAAAAWAARDNGTFNVTTGIDPTPQA